MFVLFDSEPSNVACIGKVFQRLTDTFNYSAPVVLLSHCQLSCDDHSSNCQCTFTRLLKILQQQVSVLWGTGIRGLIRGMATLPQGNQGLFVVKDNVGRPQESLEWASPRNVIFSFSALTLLVGRQQDIRPVKSWVLVCWWWWFDWSFARLIASVITYP